MHQTLYLSMLPSSFSLQLIHPLAINDIGSQFRWNEMPCPILVQCFKLHVHHMLSLGTAQCIMKILGLFRGCKHAVSNGAIRVDLVFCYTMLELCTRSRGHMFSKNRWGCRRSEGFCRRSELSVRHIQWGMREENSRSGAQTIQEDSNLGMCGQEGCAPVHV
jgi:hypothetical protein